jgi:serine/threonine-protein kinase
MEYVEGRSLGAILREQGALPPRRVAALVTDIAAGLDAAHRLGIVHRDLKPDNIMVAGEPGRETVKLVDFGIAKALEGELHRDVTAPGVVVGTPDYMAPEQFAGDPADQRTDLYSLGVIAYRMLTGGLPFAGATARETLTARLTTPPRRLAETAPDRVQPAGVQEVMDRVLARRPADRFPTAADFATALASALATAPPDGADATPTVRLDSATAPVSEVPATIRRRRLHPLVRTGAVLGLAVAAVLVISRWGGDPATAVPADSAGNTGQTPVVRNTDTSVTAPPAARPAPGRQATPSGATTEPVPALPEPDEVLAPETRDASRARAEQIYRRPDASPVIRAQAAFIVAQVYGELGRFSEALAWVSRAVAVNDSAPAGEERNRRAERYRGFLSQVQLKRKDSTPP